MTYGTKFTDQWRGNSDDMADLKRHWAETLGKYTSDELKRGVDALSERDWPPTLPEFEKMCRAPLDPATAFYEAVAGMQQREHGEIGVWSSPVVYWAAVRIGLFDLKNCGYEQIKTRWQAALRAAMQSDAATPIPSPMLALPDVGKGSTSNEAAARMLQDVKASGIGNPGNAIADGLLWAKRIRERVRLGDKSLSLTQIKFAEDAIGKFR